MIVIFCEDPLDSNNVDSMYVNEAKAIQSLGFNHYLIDFDALTAGSVQRALRYVPRNDVTVSAIYRGWMLKPAQYQLLYDNLLERGVQLVNTPKMYRHCHHLPESYNIIADYTPKSVWLPHDENFTMEIVYASLQVFDNKPIILKDYVKSQKHYWYEACYIPNSGDHDMVKKVVSRFLELQGTDLNEGLVFREFVEFQPLSQHSRSGMPLTHEFRVFVIDGNLAFSTKYWSEGDYADISPEFEQFETVMQKVNSRFFTMDVAKRTNGEWMIVELGDAQVAGLPDHADVEQFYSVILNGRMAT